MAELRRLLIAACAACLACSQPDAGVAPVSRALQLSADGGTLWVTNTDSDSISELDVRSRSLVREILLAPTPPQVVDGGAGPRYDPLVRPRAIALVDKLGKAYVAGQAANAIFVVDTAAGTVRSNIPVGAEPVAVVASPDGTAVYAVSHESATVSKIDTSKDAVVASAIVDQHPWGAAVRADGSTLYVTQFMLDAGVTAIDTATFTVESEISMPDQPQDPNSILVPNGQSRGAYAVVPQPQSGELWVPHLLLATGTPEPALVFDNTVFPTLTLYAPGAGHIDDRLLFRPTSVADGTPDAGAFIDVVSGPRDVAFTPDGKLALVADAQSEDVLVFDALARTEIALVRPIPSALLEGITVDGTGTHAYVLGRNTHDVTVLDIDETAAGGPTVTAEANAIQCLAGADPMPQDYRDGQRLFFTANSSVFPVTQNFWVACSTCHLEGQTDAVVWKFLEGPRDTPSNAGGPVNTGFLFRQATRNTILDYDETIRLEQGGSFDRSNLSELPELQSLADFVNYAIPFPQNPNVLPDGGQTPKQANGQAVFQNTGCINCHAGPYFTDSGDGNPTLSLSGPVVLHDMTALTCVTGGPYPDEPLAAEDGTVREPCLFDTPTLRGIFDTPPYFHDGSAATLEDAVLRMPDGGTLSASDLGDLVEYLKTL